MHCVSVGTYSVVFTTPSIGQLNVPVIAFCRLFVCLDVVADCLLDVDTLFLFGRILPKFSRFHVRFA